MFDLADIWARRTGHDVRLVSANDHKHSRQSMHYAGLAIDLHSSAPDELAQAMRKLGFRVLWKVPGHFGHLHVEMPGLVPTPASSTATTVTAARPARPRTDD
jgi:hypothetical protein